MLLFYVKIKRGVVNLNRWIYKNVGEKGWDNIEREN